MIAALAFAGCRPDAPAPTPLPAAIAGAASELPKGIVTLAAQISAAEGGEVTGAVVLTEEADRLVVAAALDGLAPGDYLIHVHTAAECGDVGSEQAASALGTFEVGAVGQAKFSIELADAEGPAAFVDRAVAIHARADGGARGALKGCGVLRPIAR